LVPDLPCELLHSKLYAMARKDVIRPYFAKMIVKQLLIAAYQLVEEGSTVQQTQKSALCAWKVHFSLRLLSICAKRPRLWSSSAVRFARKLSSMFARNVILVYPTPTQERVNHKGDLVDSEPAG